MTGVDYSAQGYLLVEMQLVLLRWRGGDGLPGVPGSGWSVAC